MQFPVSSVAAGTALRALTLALLGLAGCAGNIGVGEGEGEEGEGEEGEGEEGEGEEGEGEEGEGEEGEGEGEPPLPAPEGAVVLSPRFAVPADGISAIRIDLQLTPGALDAPIAGRTVVVRTREAGPNELPAGISATDGTLSVDLVSTVSGQFTVEVEVDGAVIDVGGPVVEFDACRTLEETFVQETYPVALGRCVGCHNEFGYAPAVGARFILPFPGDDDFAARGIAAVRDILAKSAEEGTDVEVDAADEETRAALLMSADETTLPLILANPVLGHTGGVVITADETREIARLRAFVSRVQAGADTCGAGSEAGLANEDILADVGLLSSKETFRRAVRVLTGLNPSAADLNAITDDATLSTVLEDELTANRRIETRLGEIWNDWLLTDAAVGRNPSYLANSFPHRTFFNPLQSEGARGVNSCDDRTPSNCCRIPEDPLNTNADPDDDIPLKPENQACVTKSQQLRTSAAREPIEIMMRIWRDDLPASTLVNGDFTIVDPALAEAYGLLQADGRTFIGGIANAFNTNPDDDATERRLVRIPETAKNDITERNASLDAWPHTGVLSVPSFLNRYPTTASNRERTRARTVMESFLAVPVMKLAAFATPEIPEGTSLENLTWAEQPCVVCHTVIDPPAGAFNMFTGASGALAVRRNCRFEGMRSPGLGFIELPGLDGPQTPAVPRPALDVDDCSAGADGTGAGALDNKGPQRLRWLADEVAAHPRFAYAVVVPLYEGILGTKVLSPPDSLDDPDFKAKARAFATQQQELAEIVAVFRAEGGRFRPVVKAILLSRSFRADTVSEAAAADAERMRVLELLEIGTGSKLATPENLDRRITALTGVPWANLRVPNRASNLSADGSYSIFFGGIDSEFVTERSRDPVAIKAAVARRLGNEVSCIAVPQEFSIVDKTKRKLFRDADLADLPIAADGTVDPAVQLVVEAQVRRLHSALWNEPVVDEAEVDASVALFYAALNEMRAPAAGGTTPTAIGNTCAALSEFTPGERIAYPATGTVVIGTGDNAIEHRRVSTDPNFTVRAWMAVLSSILADTRVLME